ncbi:MAG TPA: hypothetical protein VFX89_08830 [Gammaproteobacteria bacterium]|nr:hypothetical protein [Gammaproteobacteria bacterium]
MTISTVQADLEVRQLLASPQSAPSVRTRAVQATRAADDAARRIVSIVSRLGESLAAQYQSKIDEIGDALDELRAKLKALKAQQAALENQIRKLEALKKKMEEVFPALKAAAIAQANCRVNKGIVSERTAKIRQLQEAASAALGAENDGVFGQTRALLDKTRLLLAQMPVLFDIPGLR